MVRQASCRLPRRASARATVSAPRRAAAEAVRRANASGHGHQGGSDMRSGAVFSGVGTRAAAYDELERLPKLLPLLLER